MTSPLVEPSLAAVLPREILPNAIYTTPEAAALVRCQPGTIRHFVRIGKIRGRGRPFRILGSELLKFVS